jgi:hypothetical protein
MKITIYGYSQLMFYRIGPIEYAEKLQHDLKVKLKVMFFLF